MKSPCINICQIERATGLCTGCLRTLDEIAGWAGYSDDKRTEVLSDLKRRRAAAAATEERR